ncbi:hypothetical protein JCM8097_007522 [Rhodosporidiobolus ruineniae]
MRSSSLFLSSSSSSSENPAEALTGPGAVEEMAESGPAPRHSRSLLDLPDELLSNVFEQVYHTVRAETSEETNGIPVPTSQIRINKRIYHLARPLWFRHFTSLNYWQLDRRLSSLCRQRDSSAMIQSAKIEFPWHFSDLFALILVDVLPNLVSLTITFDQEEEGGEGFDQEIPASFSDALRSLGRLEHLRIDINNTFADRQFRLDEALPGLRRFEAIDTSVLTTAASSLSHFTLFDLVHPEHYEPVIRAARSLEIRPRTGFLMFGDEFERVFRQVTEKHHASSLHPLERLHLNFDCFSLPAAGQAFGPNHLYRTLSALQNSCLRRLELSQMPATPRMKPADFTLERVRTLVLRGSSEMYHSTSLMEFSDFLVIFPQLEQLVLEGFSFSAISGNAYASAFFRLDTAGTAIFRPILVAFLVYLGTTSVLDFRYRLEGERVEVRWTRTSRKEEFRKELWHLW